MFSVRLCENMTAFRRESWSDGALTIRLWFAEVSYPERPPKSTTNKLFKGAKQQLNYAFLLVQGLLSTARRPNSDSGFDLSVIRYLNHVLFANSCEFFQWGCRECVVEFQCVENLWMNSSRDANRFVFISLVFYFNNRWLFKPMTINSFSCECLAHVIFIIHKYNILRFTI